jgi:hypothetical protein
MMDVVCKPGVENVPYGIALGEQLGTISRHFCTSLVESKIGRKG